MAEASKVQPFVSVVIPTFNRRESLIRTLEGLRGQTFLPRQFEVIVVDDGGSDYLDDIPQKQFPFSLHILHQKNQGAPTSRNNGAKKSRGKMLIFMDDDIVPEASTLQVLTDELEKRRQTIILGVLYLPSQLIDGSPYARVVGQQESKNKKEGYVSFQECKTGMMAIKKPDFFHLGLFHDPAGDRPNWEDVDFGYRASQEGFRFWLCPSALAAHWDYSVVNLAAASERLYSAGESAPRLFQKHPGLQRKIPMFDDKGPINWHQDGRVLIFRKLARQIISSKPLVWSMERAVPTLERFAPESKSLLLLYRWIISGYIYHGYRAGLKEVSIGGSS